MDSTDSGSLAGLMDAISAKVIDLRSQAARLEQLYQEWHSLFVHSAEMGVPQSTDASSTAVELKQRLEIVDHDVTVGVKLILSGISHEKARQKLHSIYNSRPVVISDETRQILRQLDRAKEELELREAVTEATNRRQQRDARTSPVDETDAEEIYSSTSSRRSKLVENHHKEILMTRYNWLTTKILAPKTAVRMFQQGVIMQRELEAIQRSASLSQSAESLITFLMDQPYAVFQCFKTALKQTKQDDVYLVLADIDCTPNDSHQEAIRRNYIALGEMMDLEYSNLLNELFCLDVIDNREMESIRSEMTSYDMNEKLLSLLSRKSSKLFEKFVTALDKTRQEHIADVIRASLKCIASERSPSSSGCIISTGNPVSGMATLLDELFVLRMSAQHVEVYDMETRTLQQYISVKSGFDSSTRSLAACATNYCLYILNCESSTVYKLQITAKTGSNWTVDGRPTGLSVNSACNLLITCANPDKILEYTTRGSLIRQVHLHGGVTSTFAVQLTSRQFVVCQSASENHRVCLVNSNEELVDVYGDRCEAQISQLLNHPKQLLVYMNRFVLVADSGNHRIVVLSKSVRWVMDLFASAVNEPVTLCLDEARDRLYVGEWSSGRVLVFDKLSTYLDDSETCSRAEK